MLPAVTGSPGMMAYNNRMLKIRFVLKCQHTFCVDFFLHRDLAYWRQTPPGCTVRLQTPAFLSGNTHHTWCCCCHQWPSRVVVCNSISWTCQFETCIVLLCVCAVNHVNSVTWHSIIFTLRLSCVTKIRSTFFSTIGTPTLLFAVFTQASPLALFTPANMCLLTMPKECLNCYLVVLFPCSHFACRLLLGCVAWAISGIIWVCLTSIASTLAILADCCTIGSCSTCCWRMWPRSICITCCWRLWPRPIKVTFCFLKFGGEELEESRENIFEWTACRKGTALDVAWAKAARFVPGFVLSRIHADNSNICGCAWLVLLQWLKPSAPSDNVRTCAGKH